MTPIKTDPASLCDLTLPGNGPTESLERSLFQLPMGHFLVQAVHAAAYLDIAGRLAAGPRNCDDLALAAGAHPGSLCRVMRFLTQFGIFAEIETRRFALTPPAELLRDDHPSRLRQSLLYLGTEAYAATSELLYGVIFGGHGLALAEHPARTGARSRGPEPARRLADDPPGVAPWSESALASAFDFSGIATLVNLGGVDDPHALTILQGNPDMRGVFIEELHSAETARKRLLAGGVLRRCDIIAAGFHEALLAGADVCLLSAFDRLSDAEAIALMRRCRAAMPAHGCLLVIGTFLTAKTPEKIEEFRTYSPTLPTDGRPRTAEEASALVREAGFQAVRFVALDTLHGLLEARAEGA